MKALNLETVLEALSFELEQTLPRQLLQKDHPHYGAFISPLTRVDEPGHGGSSRFIMTCGLIVLARLKNPERLLSAPANEDLLERISLAADYLLRVQRDTGLIDLRNVNYDSAPDTGFAIQLLCALYELVKEQEAFQSVLPKLEHFIRRAAPGLMTGGFHTPNHRWVIVAALAQSKALFPDIDATAVIRSYLDEGFDVDEEGTYLERSIGVYDAVTNRSLLLLAEHWQDTTDLQKIEAAVCSNLDFNLHFFHADGTAETGLSRRQDYGTREIPLPLIASYLHANALYPNPLYTRVAQWLWEKASLRDADSGWQWQAYVMFKHGEAQAANVTLPESYQMHYPLNQVWRIREGELSATVYGGVSNLMTLVYGQAELSNIKISQTYFGIGNFVADELKVEGSKATLEYHGSLKLHRPGYELPLGRPVSRDAWDEAQTERGYKALPPMVSRLELKALSNGFDAHYKTLDGLNNVLVQIAFDFPAGGFWETGDSALSTAPAQELFLKNGSGKMRFGNDVIEITGGSGAHLYEHMRASEAVLANRCRVLITFLSPVDHAFSIRVFRGISG